MKFNDIQKNIFYVLATLVTGMLIAAGLVFAHYANAATGSVNPYETQYNERSVILDNYSLSLDRETIPFDKSSLMDNLMRTREDCSHYLSVLEQFIACNPQQSYVNESADQKNDLINEVANQEQAS